MPCFGFLFLDVFGLVLGNFSRLCWVLILCFFCSQVFLFFFLFFRILFHFLEYLVLKNFFWLWPFQLEGLLGDGQPTPAFGWCPLFRLSSAHAESSIYVFYHGGRLTRGMRLTAALKGEGETNVENAPADNAGSRRSVVAKKDPQVIGQAISNIRIARWGIQWVHHLIPQQRDRRRQALADPEKATARQTWETMWTIIIFLESTAKVKQHPKCIHKAPTKTP